MKADIETAKAEGANGVVIGLLTADGEVDVARTRELISLARPLSITFHRAFDIDSRAVRALETLIELGVDRVLTSGQEANVLDGLPLIVELVRRAGNRIVVMPGGGITKRNVDRIVAAAKPRNSLCRARADRERHAVSPPARVHGRRTPTARIRSHRDLSGVDPRHGQGDGIDSEHDPLRTAQRRSAQQTSEKSSPHHNV